MCFPLEVGSDRAKGRLCFPCLIRDSCRAVAAAHGCAREGGPVGDAPTFQRSHGGLETAGVGGGGFTPSCNAFSHHLSCLPLLLLLFWQMVKSIKNKHPKRFTFFNDFLKIEVQLIYNVVLVSGVQQSDSVLYIYIHTHIHICIHTCICICICSFSDSFPLQVIIRY